MDDDHIYSPDSLGNMKTVAWIAAKFWLLSTILNAALEGMLIEAVNLALLNPPIPGKKFGFDPMLAIMSAPLLFIIGGVSTASWRVGFSPSLHREAPMIERASFQAFVYVYLVIVVFGGLYTYFPETMYSLLGSGD